MIGGKVLDAFAFAALARRRHSALVRFDIAPTLGLTLYVPSLRDQRTPRVPVRRCVHHEDAATTTSTDLQPHDVAGHYDVQIGIGIQVPRCTYLYQPAHDDSAEATLWFRPVAPGWCRGCAARRSRGTTPRPP